MNQNWSFLALHYKYVLLYLWQCWKLYFLSQIGLDIEVYFNKEMY